jgi:hypothetical protein
MYKDLRHFLRFMPLRFFLTGGLWSGQAPTLAFYLAPREARLLLMRGKKPVGYEPELSSEPDSPPLPEGSGISRAVQARQLLSPKLARRYGLSTDVEHLFVVDCSLKDVYLQVTTLGVLRRKTPTSLLEDLDEDPARILEEWSDHRPYRWALLGNDFRPEPLLKAGVDEQVLLVGLPAEYCEQLETWSETEGATVTAIVPLPVAAYAYLTQVVLPKDVARPGICVVVTDSLALCALSRAGKVEVVHLHKTLSEALRSIPAIVADLRLPEHFIYIWASGDQLTQVDLPPEAIALDAEQLRSTAGSSLVVAESHGKKITHDEPVAHLLAWLSQL